MKTWIALSRIQKNHHDVAMSLSKSFIKTLNIPPMMYCGTELWAGKETKEELFIIYATALH